MKKYSSEQKKWWNILKILKLVWWDSYLEGENFTPYSSNLPLSPELSAILKRYFSSHIFVSLQPDENEYHITGSSPKKFYIASPVMYHTNDAYNYYISHLFHSKMYHDWSYLLIKRKTGFCQVSVNWISNSKWPPYLIG